MIMSTSLKFNFGTVFDGTVMEQLKQGFLFLEFFICFTNEIWLTLTKCQNVMGAFDLKCQNSITDSSMSI